MMASEELGIDLKKIKVINTDTDIKPWDVGVHASRTSFVAGNSLLGAIKILNEKLNEMTSKSSLQQNVKIYNDVVDKISTPKVSMFVHRFMGFGGRMAGIPLTTPFSGWINNEIKQKLLP
jgi:CO/xanthine dehydrogenase Mo-binding subunit